MKYIIKELKLSLISFLFLTVVYGFSVLLFYHPFLWFVVYLVIVLFIFNRIVEHVIIPSLNIKNSSPKRPRFSKLLLSYDQGRSYNHENTSIDSSSERPRLWKDVNRNDKDFRTSFNHENSNKPTGNPPLKFKRSDDPNK